MPIVRWGTRIKQELSEGWSRVIDHELQATVDGHSWTVEFPVYIDAIFSMYYNSCLHGPYLFNAIAPDTHPFCSVVTLC